MRFYADLHIHSKYSRACSRDCDLEHLAWWAARKGVGVLGTGDITHPAWASEIREKLVPAEPGLFRLRPDLERDVLRRLPASCREPVRFLLSVEISTIYKRSERTRKVHHLLYVPDLSAMAELTARLARVGNLAADGRPILGLDSRDLLDIVLHSGEDSYLVPAHLWTPWFSALGSRSGFDSVAECYADLAEHIFAVETGLSSDPAMSWRVSALDQYQLVSNSDAHSPPALGREATVFDAELSYPGIRQALRTGDGLAGTIEFFPEEGKYHLDGHRRCAVRLEPADTREHAGRCPSCGREVTVGVLHRVELLADRPVGVRRPGAAPFRCLVPLPELIGEIRGVGPKSKTVQSDVAMLVERLGPELSILERVPLSLIEQAGSPVLAEAVARLRRGEVSRDAGYDGEYGVIRVFEPKELADLGAAPTLFELPPAPPPAGPAEGEHDVPLDPAPGPPDRRADPAPGPRAGWPADAYQTTTAHRGAAASGADLGVGQPAALAGQADLTGAPAGMLAGLDPDQRAAAVVGSGPLLIVAGPGTGKTRTLTHRLAHLVSTGRATPAQCLAITFTRRAAEELRDRLAALLPAATGQLMVSTFHGLGLHILRAHAERCGLAPGFRVVDDVERLALLRAAFGESAGGRAPRRLAAEVSRLTRAWAVLPATVPGQPPRPADEELTGGMARYRAVKRGENVVDLDDLVGLPVALLSADQQLSAGYQGRWRWLCVDEYQDIDETQYRLLRLLSPPDGNLSVIGDPDQAIYGFRGADVRFFLRFREDFPAARTVTLSRSYRSSASILRGALQAIAPGSLVPGRSLVPAAQPVPGRPAARRIVLHAAADERAEASFVVSAIDRLLGGSSFLAFDRGRVEPGRRGDQELAQSFADFAVLYRTDAQARALVEALEAEGVPYQKRSHHRLAGQPGVRDVLARLRAQPPAWSAEPRPVLSRLRAAAQAAIDAAGGLRPPDEPDPPGPRGPVPPAAARPPGGPRWSPSWLQAVPGADPATGQSHSARVARIRAALDLLSPLAARSGTDVDRFLAELALGAEVDVWDPRADRVSLLTLHASKGLEFPVVFLVGCEDGLLPLRWAGAGLDPSSSPAMGDGPVRAAEATVFPDPTEPWDAPAYAADPLAEERRLLFVGMTRARSQLLISHVQRRSWQGQLREARRSRYLDDIDQSLFEHSSERAPRRNVQLRLL